MKIKSIRILLAGLLMIPVLALGVTQFASASDLTDGAKVARGDSVDKVCLFTNSKTGAAACKSGIFTTIVNVFLFIIGAVSVLMIIYGGIRYTISGGDAKNVTAAKDTVLYAVVGLVVAIMAYAIVNFVVNQFT